MSDFGFLYDLNVNGKRIVTQSVSGARIGTMLEHIAKTINEQEQTYGKGNVTVTMLKARLNENTALVDPKRMESLSTLVTMAAEHYNQKAGKLVVEMVYPKTKMVENLKKVLADPKKNKKLVEWMTAAQQERMRVTKGTTNGTRISGEEAKQADIRRKAAREKAKIVKEGEDDETLKLPDLKTGDTLLVGKFKNRKAEIKGFGTDEHNQPTADTNHGEQKIFKPRIAKLMPGAEPEKPAEAPAPVDEASHGQVAASVRASKDKHPEKYCHHRTCLWRKSSGPCPKHDKK
jgi:hypothetical protein